MGSDLESTLTNLLTRLQDINAQLQKAKGEITTRRIVAQSGVYKWEGQPSFSDFEITCRSGIYRWTGNSATLHK